jgi:UDP-2,3-diacylglucosamine pyrophosphatase LpxH
MLIIASDIHLVDGTCAKSISPSAFYLFADRLRETAIQASWRADNSYRPIDGIDLVLMGDILDPLHSTRWLDTQPGDTNYIRPWLDPTKPGYDAKLREVTRAIIETNAEGLDVIKKLSQPGALTIPPAASRGKPDYESQNPIAIPIRVYYTIGNHDWYYHLPDKRFDAIRQDIIDVLGLANPANIFPYDMNEYGPLDELSARYKVLMRHGDYYDHFNYDVAKGRNVGTLGDVFAMEVLNRFPVEVQKEIGAQLPDGLLDGLRRIVNVRPVLATPLWIATQIKAHAGSPALATELKNIWDRVCDEFLANDFVRKANKPFKLDTVDALKIAVKLTDRTSLTTINELINWLRNKIGSGDISYATHALNEPAVQKEQARFVVYGHTHFHEVVPLDAYGYLSDPESQIYINSGTWHSYYAIAAKNHLKINQPDEFVPYQSMTYLAFYKDGERGGRSFEAWSGTFA